jgi:hypothetical protein
MLLAVSSMIMFGCSKSTSTEDAVVDTLSDGGVDASVSVAADVTAVDAVEAADVSATQAAADVSPQD